MKRALKRITIALPQLSQQTEGSKSLVLQDANEQTNGVFTPSALRTHQSARSATTNRLFAALLFGLFIIMLLLSFLVGINVYQALNTLAENESTQRLEQSFRKYHPFQRHDRRGRSGCWP